MDTSASASTKPAHALSGSVAVGIFSVVMLAVGLSVWGYLQTVPRPIAISEILGNLREYDGRSVTVRGTAEDVFNVAGFKWYRLRDDTGSIVVVTQRGLPERGAWLTTTGIVKEVFNLAGVNATVLQEPLPPGT